MESFLKQLGLSSHELLIYKALLKRGGSKVSEIAIELGIKRTSTQEYIRSLLDKGLIVGTKFGNKYLYQTDDPDKIRQVISERQFVVDRLIHDLKAKPATEDWQVKSSETQEVEAKLKRAKRQKRHVREFGTAKIGGAVIDDSQVMLWSTNTDIPSIEIVSKEIAQFHKDILKPF